MTVESALEDTSINSGVEPAVISEPSSIPADDQAMNDVWDRLVTNNGAERENGRFVSPDPEKRAAAEASANEPPAQVGEGGEPADASTVSTDVPLPPNWHGKDDLWAKIPADVRAEVAAFQNEQHAKLSDLGRKVAAFEPLNGVGSEISGYLQQAAQRAGAAYDGPRTAAEGVSYLFNIQRMMDADPVSTIMQIADTYGTREQLAAALGVNAAPAADTNSALLAKIDRLEAAIRQGTDPSQIEQVVDRREEQRRHDEEVSRLTTSKPLYSKIPEARMVFFINEAWDKLGPTATKAAVFDHAYTAAVEADPALRAQSMAAKTAANDTVAKAEAAKRGTAVNIRSTAPSKPARQSEDSALEEVWAKHHPQG